MRRVFRRNKLVVSNGDLIILDGCTFFSSRASGDVEVDAGQGLFYRDVRHLSRWHVTLDGQPLAPLTSDRVDYYSARALGVPAASNGDQPVVSVRRDRFVTEGVHEDVVVENLTAEPQRVRLEIAFGSDFADTMEAQQDGNGEGRHWQDLGQRSVTLWNERDGYRRGTTLTFSRRPRLTKKSAHFDLELRARESWSLCVDIVPIEGGERHPPLLRCGAFHDYAPKMPMTVDEWLESAPTLDSSSPALKRTYEQGLLDLAALRIRPDAVTIKWAMPAGGLPWFLTVFGRDSLVTAYEALPFRAELAEATLEALAELQATEWDNWRDAEPGKILHELRRGTLAKTGRIPHTPYYGAHDTTPLWLVVLDEYERWSGDQAFVRDMEPHARAALAWLEGPADMDADGYIEFKKRSTSKMAIDNQCWRDSEGSILFADGRGAEPPLAIAEQQGLAYDARVRTARLMREVWGDEETAAKLEEDAAALKERFNRDFWSSEKRHYALALDGEKRQVDALTSDIGHLLWSGIVDEQRASATVRSLLQEDMFSGWGVRSLSAAEKGYQPLGYHLGTVWPHDTAIVAEGMRRYGFREEAARLGQALLDAAHAFDHQLPEVFGGFPRDQTNLPVRYPDALTPQSWAAAAPLLALRTFLGLDVVDGELRSVPCLPAGLDRLRLSGIDVRGTAVDVEA